MPAIAASCVGVVRVWHEGGSALKIPICSKCANGQDNSICVTTKWGTSSEAAEKREEERQRQREEKQNERK